MQSPVLGIPARNHQRRKNVLHPPTNNNKTNARNKETNKQLTFHPKFSKNVHKRACPVVLPPHGPIIKTVVTNATNRLL